MNTVHNHTPNGIDQLLQSAYIVARQIWRKRWLMVMLAVVAAPIGWTFVSMLPNKYESSATLYIDSQTLLQPVLKGIAIESNSANEIAAIAKKTLLSRPNIERVVERADLGLSAMSQGQKAGLVAGLEREIKIEGGDPRGDHRSNEVFFKISYVHKDPQKAYKVVQSLIDIFVESNLSQKRKDTDVTRTFLDQQIADYEAKLVLAEDALRDFKRRNIGLMPALEGNYFQRLSAAETALKQAQLSLREATRRRDELKRQLSGNTEGSVNLLTASNPDVDAIDRRIQNLTQTLDGLLLQYTEKHPNVISTRQSINELNAQKEKLLKQPYKAGRSGDSQAVQEIKVEYGKSEAEVVALTERAREYEKEVGELRRSVTTIPEVEAELKRLNRDYDVNKKNYEDLIARRESARISRDAQESTDDLQFNVVDPPKVPLVPLSPNRLLLMTLVLLGSIAGGAAVAWLASQIKPTFDSLRTLRQSVDLPVYGAVSLVVSPAKQRQSKVQIVLFSLIFCALLVAYGLLVANHLVATRAVVP